MNELINNLHFSHEYWILVCPFITICIDFITGLINSWAKKEFQSSKMRTGLSKKVGEISILVLGEVFTAAFSLPSYFIQGIAIYIIIMELMSIFENIDKMGVPVPKFVKKVINNTADTVNNGDIQDINNLAQSMAKTVKSESQVSHDGQNEIDG